MSTLPPAVAVESRVDDSSMGAVEVYVSDPDVRVDLSVQIFDWADWTRYDSSPAPRGKGGHALRMILWLRGDLAQTVRWAVVLQGGARYRPPLPLYTEQEERAADALDTDPEQRYLGGWLREVGDVQVIEGDARVGPSAFTERPADWAGEAIGPFLTRTGSWPEFGSRSILRLPSFSRGHEGSSDAEEWFGTGKHALYGPTVFEPTVYFGTTSLPEFLRVDYASPPVTGDNLAWAGEDDLSAGASVLLTDIQREQEEQDLRFQASLILGFAAGALLSAVATWIDLGIRVGSTRAGAKPRRP